MKKYTFLFAILLSFFVFEASALGQGIYPKNLKKNGVLVALSSVRATTIDTANSKNKLLRSNGGATPPSWVTLGSNLSFSNDTLNASGGGASAKQWEYSGIKGAAGLAAGTTHYISVTQLLTYNDANVTTYDCSDPSNNQIDAAGYFPKGGMLKNFYFRGNVPGSGKTFTITVMKNGTATSATYTVANTDVDANSNGLKSDLTHSITVADGDLITYRIVTSSGANSFTGNMISEFDSN